MEQALRERLGQTAFEVVADTTETWERLSEAEREIYRHMAEEVAKEFVTHYTPKVKEWLSRIKEKWDEEGKETF